MLWPVGRRTRNWPETGLGEINGSLHDFPKADFWPGITSGLPVIRPQSTTNGAQNTTKDGLRHHRGQLSNDIRPMGGQVPRSTAPSGDDPGQ
jgi:hypothetical protein